MDIGSKAIYIVLFLQICTLLTMLMLMNNFHSNLVKFSAYCWSESDITEDDIVTDDFGRQYVNITPDNIPQIVFPD